MWALIVLVILCLLPLAAAFRPKNERTLHRRPVAIRATSTRDARDKAARELFRQAKRQRTFHASS